MANTWQGEFLWQNLMHDKYEGTSPVGSFPPNGYGRAAGDVWEWTSNHFTPDHFAARRAAPRRPAQRLLGSRELRSDLQTGLAIVAPLLAGAATAFLNP